MSDTATQRANNIVNQLMASTQCATPLPSSASSSSISSIVTAPVASHEKKAVVVTEVAEEDLVLRPLQLDDYKKGFLTILSQLTLVGDITPEQFAVRFRELKNANDVYHIMVIEDKSRNKIIASATLFIEKKFLRSCSQVGHIEDVVVDETYRGKRLGYRVVNALVEIAKQKGCYKVILDCAEHNVAFYQKIGFQRKEIEMVMYFEKK